MKQNPVLYLREDNELEWRESLRNVSIFFPDRLKFTYDCPVQLLNLPKGLFKGLQKDFDAETLDELWEALRKNITFNAPGSPLHESAPAVPPETPRSTTRTRKNGLTINAGVPVGPPQMVHIALWLIDQHKGLVLTDDEINQSLVRMQKINKMVTRQDPFLVFRYYRRKLIQIGVLEEA